ncbi:MAG TPA: hypothetical protein DCL54_02480 [Alphaproteobacteria bacterium]|nr:hypothetical protein [Alphaproteobacteria bacterium]HAJ45432.1 hypothetical protein [Alphaproteobacteria bacterium]
MKAALRATAAVVMGLSLTGCAAVAVVDTAVGVTTTVVGTAVDVTGAVISTAADAVTPSEKPDCSKAENKDKDACKK